MWIGIVLVCRGETRVKALGVWDSQFNRCELNSASFLKEAFQPFWKCDDCCGINEQSSGRQTTFSLNKLRGESSWFLGCSFIAHEIWSHHLCFISVYLSMYFHFWKSWASLMRNVWVLNSGCEITRVFFSRENPERAKQKLNFILAYVMMKLFVFVD